MKGFESDCMSIWSKSVSGNCLYDKSRDSEPSISLKSRGVFLESRNVCKKFLHVVP